MPGAQASREADCRLQAKCHREVTRGDGLLMARMSTRVCLDGSVGIGLGTPSWHPERLSAKTAGLHCGGAGAHIKMSVPRPRNSRSRDPRSPQPLVRSSRCVAHSSLHPIIKRVIAR